MSIYGDMLPYFSELFIEVDYFEQTTLVGAGYQPVGNVLKKSVIFQNTPEGTGISGPMGRLAKRANWSNMAITEEARLWSPEPLQEGWFVSVKNRYYRILKHIDWLDIGGFSVYTIDKVVGNSGKSENVLPLKEGVF